MNHEHVYGMLKVSLSKEVMNIVIDSPPHSEDSLDSRLVRFLFAKAIGSYFIHLKFSYRARLDLSNTMMSTKILKHKSN